MGYDYDWELKEQIRELEETLFRESRQRDQDENRLIKQLNAANRRVEELELEIAELKKEMAGE